MSNDATPVNDSGIITPFFFIRHAPVIKISGHLPDHDADIDPGPYPAATTDALNRLHKILPSQAEWTISPLARTRQTAAMLQADLKPLSMRVEPALREQDFGAWHGREIAKIWPEIAPLPKHNWAFINSDFTPPEGEPFTAQIDRIAAWCRLIEQQKSFAAPQVIIAHAGTIRAIAAHILGISTDIAMALSVPHFGFLSASLMSADHAKDAHHGGRWQLHHFG